MFQLFAKKKEVPADPVITRSEAELVEEIHHAFFTEVDRLLEEARVMRSHVAADADLLQKAAHLSRLGFLNSKEVTATKEERIARDKIEAENRDKQRLLRAIDYFSTKYPLYKFITTSSVQRICTQYDLVYGGVHHYKGTVPDKNIQEMLNFRIDEKDKAWYVDNSIYFIGGTGRTMQRITNSYYSAEMAAGMRKQNKDNRRNQTGAISPLTRLAVSVSAMDLPQQYDPKLAPLEICAPQQDFDMDGMETEQGQLVHKAVPVPDPVVLQPVMFEHVKYYLIVTAWGPEASDPEVQNPKMN